MVALAPSHRDARQGAIDSGGGAAWMISGRGSGDGEPKGADGKRK